MENDDELKLDGMKRKLESAQNFIADIAKSGDKHSIPPAIAVAIFGMFSRTVVQDYIENGMSKEDAIRRVATDFTDGLGIKAIFRLSANGDGKLH
jgi:hypothetical protein